MPAAGSTARVGLIPGQRIATTEITSDSAGFTTTETAVATVTADLIEGGIYRVRASVNFSSGTDGDVIFVRTHVGNGLAGATRHSSRLVLQAGAGIRVGAEFEHKATADGEQTFTLSGQRESGSSTCQLDAGNEWPSYFYVDFIRMAEA